MIETLLLDGTDPAFREGVEVGGLGRELQGFNANGAEDGRKSLGEFGVAVVEQEAGIGHGPVRGGEVAGDLFEPCVFGIGGEAAEDDSARLQLQEEQDIERGQAGGGPDFSGEKVGGPEHVLVPAKERGPSRVAFAFGCGAKAMAFENVADRLVGNLMAHIGQSADDAIITPTGILAGELEHQRFNFDRDGGAGRLAFAVAGEIPFTSDELAMPFEQGRRLHHGEDIG